MFFKYKREKNYRWYVDSIGISGVCKSTNIKQARIDIYNYITNQFDDMFPLKRNNFSEKEIYIWQFENDDDYNTDFPNCLATNY